MGFYHTNIKVINIDITIEAIIYFYYSKLRNSSQNLISISYLLASFYGDRRCYESCWGRNHQFNSPFIFQERCFLCQSAQQS